jgi:hypothetical protein
VEIREDGTPVIWSKSHLNTSYAQDTSNEI